MTTVRQELEARLAAFAAAQIPPLVVSYESIPFTKPTSVAWLECTVASVSTISATVDAKRTRERGLFSINVWMPSGKGVGKAEALAQAVVSTFPVVPKTGTVSIEAPGNAAKAVLDTSGWIIIPISFAYRYEGEA